MYCKNCGKQIAEDSRYCSYCGSGQALSSHVKQITIVETKTKTWMSPIFGGVHQGTIAEINQWLSTRDLLQVRPRLLYVNGGLRSVSLTYDVASQPTSSKYQLFYSTSKTGPLLTALFKGWIPADGFRLFREKFPFAAVQSTSILTAVGLAYGVLVLFTIPK